MMVSQSIDWTGIRQVTPLTSLSAGALLSSFVCST